MKSEIVKELERYGLQIDEPYELSPTDLIIQIMQQSEIRLMYAIPIIIEINKSTIDFNMIHQALESNKNQLEMWMRIHKISLDILQEKKGSDAWFNEFKTHYLELKENIIQNDADKKKNIEKEMIAHYDLTKLFTNRQIEIIKKRANNEKLNRTEIEYYSRAIKSKLKSILNDDVIDICKRAF